MCRYWPVGALLLMLLYETSRVKVSVRHPSIDAVPPANGVCDSALKVQMLFPRLRGSRQLLHWLQPAIKASQAL